MQFLMQACIYTRNDVDFNTPGWYSIPLTLSPPPCHVNIISDDLSFLSLPILPLPTVHHIITSHHVILSPLTADSATADFFISFSLSPTIADSAAADSLHFLYSVSYRSRFCRCRLYFILSGSCLCRFCRPCQPCRPCRLCRPCQPCRLCRLCRLCQPC